MHSDNAKLHQQREEKVHQQREEKKEDEPLHDSCGIDVRILLEEQEDIETSIGRRVSIGDSILALLTEVPPGKEFERYPQGMKVNIDF